MVLFSNRGRVLWAVVASAGASWTALGAILEGSTPRKPMNCDADMTDPTIQLQFAIDTSGHYDGVLQPLYDSVMDLARGYAPDGVPTKILSEVRLGQEFCTRMTRDRMDPGRPNVGIWGTINDWIDLDQPLGPSAATADVLTTALSSLGKLRFFEGVSLPDSFHVDTMNVLIIVASQPMNTNANSRLFDCCSTAKQETIRNYLYDSNLYIWLFTSTEIADSYTNGLKAQSRIFHTVYDDGQSFEEKVKELYDATRCAIGGFQDQWGVSDKKPWGGEVSYLVDFKLLDSFRRGARPVDHSLSHWLYHFAVFNKPITCDEPDDLLAVIEESPLTQCTQKEDTTVLSSWWSIGNRVADILEQMGAAAAPPASQDGAGDQLLAMYNTARFTEWCSDPNVCPEEEVKHRVAVIYTSEGPDASFPCDGMRYPFPSASDPVTDCIETGAPQISEVIGEFTRAGVTPVVILSDDAPEDAETSWSSIMSSANGLFSRENGQRLYIHVDLAVKQILFGADDENTEEK